VGDVWGPWLVVRGRFTPEESRKQSVFLQVFEGFSVHARALLALPDGMAFGYLCSQNWRFVIAYDRFAPME
jgi:hypothetical protein